jgi:hypothetical protein
MKPACDTCIQVSHAGTKPLVKRYRYRSEYRTTVRRTLKGCGAVLTASEVEVVGKVQTKSDHRYKGSRFFKKDHPYGPFKQARCDACCRKAHESGVPSIKAVRLERELTEANAQVLEAKRGQLAAVRASKASEAAHKMTL